MVPSMCVKTKPKFDPRSALRLTTKLPRESFVGLVSFQNKQKMDKRPLNAQKPINPMKRIDLITASVSIQQPKVRLPQTKTQEDTYYITVRNHQVPTQRMQTDR